MKSREVLRLACHPIGQKKAFVEHVLHELREVGKLGSVAGRNSGAVEEHHEPLVHLIHEVGRDPGAVGNEFRQGVDSFS